MTREEIIKGLGKIGDFFRARADMAVGDGKMMLLNWMKCAEEAAEAMTPRVMTLEEAKNASGYVIVQSRSCNILELQLIKDGFTYDSLTVPIAVDDLWWEGYNKHWRLWTSVPTDEQRETTPWLNMS